MTAQAVECLIYIPLGLGYKQTVLSVIVYYSKACSQSQKLLPHSCHTMFHLIHIHVDRISGNMSVTVNEAGTRVQRSHTPVFTAVTSQSYMNYVRMYIACYARAHITS